LVVERLEELHGSIDRWMAANEPYIAHITPLEKALGDEDPIQMMLCGTVERMRRAEGRLLEHPAVTAVGTSPRDWVPGAEIALHRTEYADRNLSILDILPLGCSKGSALTHLAERLNIKMDEVLAIGDNWNDLSMLELAGRAVLMENAPEELKEHALRNGWSLGKRFDEDGVAVAVEQAIGIL
jgi:hydroxymethylpyrimidine pyrophosphatase-like HAD family hydrolase